MEQFGNTTTTAPDMFDPAASYFIVLKIVAQDDVNTDAGDQIFFKVFTSGVDTIPALDDITDWTLIGDTTTNSSAIIESISFESSPLATWSIDEFRVENQIPSEPFPPQQSTAHWWLVY